MLAIFQGELGAAITDLETSTTMAGKHGDALACALGYTYQCLAFVFAGRHAEAAAAGATAEDRLHAIGHVSGLVSLDIHLGYLHLLTGQPDRAIERCAQGLRLLDRGERWARSYLQVITALGLFLRGEGEASTAAACESLQQEARGRRPYRDRLLPGDPRDDRGRAGAAPAHCLAARRGRRAVGTDR